MNYEEEVFSEYAKTHTVYDAYANVRKNSISRTIGHTIYFFFKNLGHRDGSLLLREPHRVPVQAGGEDDPDRLSVAGQADNFPYKKDEKRKNNNKIYPF